LLEFARAEKVTQNTARRLDVAEPQSVSDAIEVSTGESADLVDVEAHAEKPDDAAEFANAYAREFVAYADELGRSFDGEAEVLRRADQPAEPVSPKTVRNTLLALLAGLLGGVVVAFLVERLDHRVRSARELDGLLGAPLLGRISASPALWLDPALTELPAAEGEMFQIARVGIRYLDVDREIRSVLLTSAEAGDGKTTTAIGLAACAATSGDGVLLIEADMRQPSLAAVVEPVQSGLSTVLEGRIAWRDALTGVDVTVGAEDVSGSIDVLMAGTAPANPTQLIESERMARLLEEAESEYDLVVIDTPPVTILPDGIPLMSHVDGVIVVVGLRRETREDLEELRKRLEQVDAPLIGAIANFAAAPAESYFEYIRAHEAAVAEAGTVPLRPSTPRSPRRRPSGRRPRTATLPQPPPQTKVVALPDGPVDLNQVTFEELRALDLSITQARRLLTYRDRWGGFSSVDQIDELPGFPEPVREELKQRVTI
jgi:capsular exopolysaccharide synthesis family protein